MTRRNARSRSRVNSTTVPRGRCTWSARCGESVPMRDLPRRLGSAKERQGRNPACRAGEWAGRVSLSDAIARRASEYALRPVLFDGALQIFSAGAATVEDHKPRLRLPVRFAKIIFLRSPGASSLVRATVQQCNDECVEGRLEMYDGAGKPCVLVEGFRAVSVSGARRSGSAGSSRNVLYHLAWERTAPQSRPPSQEPPALD